MITPTNHIRRSALWVAFERKTVTRHAETAKEMFLDLLQTTVTAMHELPRQLLVP